MPATEKYDLGAEEKDERERSERERKELLKKEAEDIAINIALKRARFRQYLSDRQLEKEIIALEKKWEHMRQKYERSLKEIRRFEEEKAKNDHSAEQKKRLADIDKELEELARENERFKAEGWLSTPEKNSSGHGRSEKDAAEKDTAEKDAAEKDAAGKDAPEKKKGLLDDVQERIRGIIGREKSENDRNFSEMKDELKSAMADLVAKRVAFIDPNDPRENFIRGDKKNEEHYRQAYNKLMSGENKAFNRTIDDMGSFVFLGVKYSRAEEPQEREKAKSHLKAAIIGFVLVFVLIVALRIATPLMTDWMNNNS